MARKSARWVSNSEVSLAIFSFCCWIMARRWATSSLSSSKFSLRDEDIDSDLAAGARPLGLVTGVVPTALKPFTAALSRPAGALLGVFVLLRSAGVGLGA